MSDITAYQLLGEQVKTLKLRLKRYRTVSKIIHHQIKNTLYTLQKLCTEDSNNAHNTSKILLERLQYLYDREVVFRDMILQETQLRSYKTVQEIAEMAYEHIILENKQHTIILDNMPHKVIETVPEWLLEALLLLLENALIHTPAHTRITISYDNDAFIVMDNAGTMDIKHYENTINKGLEDIDTHMGIVLCRHIIMLLGGTLNIEIVDKQYTKWMIYV